jgi:predicted nucleic acid-binding protein
MIVYLDTSVVLRVLFRQDNPLGTWGEWQEAYSSELMGVEARRIIDRLRLDLSLDDQGVVQAQEELTRMERAIGLIPLTRTVLRRASSPMATAVGTLDAIHVASALLFNEQSAIPLVFATHDRQQMTGARALGLECTGL